MIFIPANLVLGPLITVLVVSFSSAYSFEESGKISKQCHSSCTAGNFSKKVPYPFGFSAGCPIKLKCSNPLKIGDFRVNNFTSDGILIDVSSNCKRRLHSIFSLFGENYAPSWSNSLLLQNCSKLISGCEINPSFLARNFRGNNGCDISANNITCFPKDDANISDVLSSLELNRTQCSFLFSSISLVSANANSGVFMNFGKINLEWWIEGSCNNSSCDQNAICKNVRLGGGKLGFRCLCKDGFIGDGFVDGNGCRRANDCTASRYLLGDCGGATRIVVLVGGIIAGALLMAGLAFICYFARRRSTTFRNQKSAKRLLCEAASNSSVPFYPFKEIERASNCFDDKQRLGTGAYGTVYAGKLQNDEWVAIKRFRYRDPDSIDQVMNEIKLLSSVSHPNLVRLLGCCIEEGEPILVYEFMPNGTLSQHLQRERGRGTGLPWTIRLTIAAETAKAIAYLHSVNPPIYHRDIKSSNILLDYNYKSKVADFGLSRLGNGIADLSHISTAPQGTPGYLDPQYHQYFHLSDKSDVYSFGVVLVEIITAMKVVDFSRPHSEVNLAALAIDKIGRGCVDEIIDPYLEPHRDAWTLSSIHSVAELAFRCLAFHRDMRPTMIEVAEELEQVRLSSWVPNMYTASPITSSCSSDDESEKSCMSGKQSGVGSKRLFVPRREDCLKSLDEVKDSSPVSVQDPWLSEQSSPSANSLLLGNVIQ